MPTFKRRLTMQAIESKKRKCEFKAAIIFTRGYRFNRDEANAR